MRVLGAAAIAALLLCTSAQAEAEAPSTYPPDAEAGASAAPAPRNDAPRPKKNAKPRARPISLALTVGYGLSLEDAPDNPWGVGFGARGGYNLGAVFLGARFVFYVGEEPSNIWELGIEAGYDLKAGIFTARPGVGLGIANVTIELGPTAMESETKIYIAPGLSALLDLTREVFIGAEGRVQMILADPGREAVIVLGSVGMRF